MTRTSAYPGFSSFLCAWTASTGISANIVAARSMKPKILRIKSLRQKENETAHRAA